MTPKWLFFIGLLGASRMPCSGAQDAGYDRKALQSLTEFRQLHRKTVDGRLCAAAFVQDDRTYTDCTTARNPEGLSGREWCYVEVQLLGKGARDWDYCQEVVNYEAVRVAYRRLQFTLRKYEQRMQIIEDVLSGSKRAFEELQANLSKVRALQAVAAHVMEDVERDADEASNNRNNCSAVRGYEDEPTPDGVRATFFSNPFFRGPPAGYQDDATIDLKVEGSSPFPGVPVQSFSVRWDGYLVPTVSDRYRLFTYADCGIRVFLDDSPIIVDRMPAPEESAAFSEDPVQPLPPSGFTGVAKIFSSPQDLKAGHRHRLRVEYFHLSSHKYKNPDSARAVLGWTSNTLPEQTIPPENYFQSDSPPLLKIAGLPGNDYDLSTLDDGQLAFIDSGSHFIADVPAYYRGLRLLRTQKHPKNTTVHFEVSAECVVFVGVPRGAVPPSASQQLVFQPVKFAAVDNAISIYFASSRDVRRTLVVTTAVCVLPHRIELQVKASEQQRFSIYSARILPGLVAFDVPPAQHDCTAGLSGMNMDMPFGSWRTPPGRSVGENLMVSFTVPVELSEMQFKTLDDPATWPTEIAVEFPGTQETLKFPVTPGDHTYQFTPRVVRGAKVQIIGNRTLDTSAGTGGSVAFIGIPCIQAKEEEKEDNGESISISFGEMTSRFIPAGFKQDDGSPKARRGAFVFGWEHKAPLFHPGDCKESSSIKSGVSFPEPNCSAADHCSPFVDCDYPNSWSIDMPSLGTYMVTVEVGSPCGEARLTNLFVNEVAFISNQLLHAGQYTKAVGQVILLASPIIRLTATTRVTLQAVTIEKIKTKKTPNKQPHQPHHAQQDNPAANTTPTE
ncbi:uncharacterized protein LOC34622979 [Cyclospora cayetanensis]|uniref:Uncharacterized protein LOC34622979 n=1 Tax=Cyclospora cayetanensis TaxID=88456 RepID=A0A6P6S1C9_9EIME|nr:uncharacterized protein LOC34622979 [Cyclospora cayetanensis]